MGRGILCVGNTAAKPYFLPKLDRAVYTVEELCYCIRESTFLMDEDMVCLELVDWLRGECGLAELADSLYGFVKTKSSAGAFLAAILEYTGFYAKEDIDRIERFLRSEKTLPWPERQKKAADYLAENGKYELALERYRELLRDTRELDNTFCSGLYHNIGVVYGRLFRFDKAAEFLERAYGLSGDREDILAYLAAKRLALPQEEYVDWIAGQTPEYYELSMELEQRTAQAMKEWNETREAAPYEQEEIGEALLDAGERLKSEYRNMRKGR